jgi:hypothetical protein
MEKKNYLKKGGIYISKRTSKCQEIKSLFNYPEYKGGKTLRNIDKKILPTRRLVPVTAIPSETALCNPQGHTKTERCTRQNMQIKQHHFSILGCLA